MQYGQLTKISKKYKVSTRTLQRWIRRGGIPPRSKLRLYKKKKLALILNIKIL